MIPAILLEHEMHVSRAHAVPLQAFQQSADGTVVGDRVADGLDCVEPELSLCVTLHHATLTGTLASWVLDVVVAAGVCLPDVDPDVRDGVALGVLDTASNEHGLTVGIR
jgi:hypothetical protein